MDSKEYKGFKLRETKCDRENRLCEMYSRVLYRNFELTSESFVSSVEKFLNTRKELSSKDLNSLIASQCAHYFQLGVHDTCMVMENFYEFTKHYPNAIDIFRLNQNINICCLGQPAIFEAVAICSVIDDILTKFGRKGESQKRQKRQFFPQEVYPTSISLTFISKAEELDSVSRDILISANNYFRTVRVEKCEYLHQDFSNRFSKHVKRAIGNASVVTMVKFLSSCRSSEVQIIIKDTLSNLKPGKILFYMDVNSPYGYKHLSERTQNSEHFNEVYRSLEPKEYYLEEEILDVQRDLYFDSLVKSVKNCFQPTVSSAWIRCCQKKFVDFQAKKVNVIDPNAEASTYW